ncbi:hypothetical protein ACLOJK_029205 [Asimina triloba]
MCELPQTAHYATGREGLLPGLAVMALWPSGRLPLFAQLCVYLDASIACLPSLLLRWNVLAQEDAVRRAACGVTRGLMAWTSSATGAASQSGLGGKRATLPVIVRVDAAGRRARCRALPSFSPSFVNEEGRSWICNHDVVAVLANCSDHPIGASLVRDLDQLHVAVILGGLDLRCMSSPELTVWCSGGAL